MSRLVLAFVLVACAVEHDVEIEDGDSDVVVEDLDADELKADDPSLVWFTPITKEYFLPSAKIRTETRMLFKSEAEWVAFFGQPSPGIDFTTKWAIFYTPGSQTGELATTRGWRAKFARVRLSSTGKTLSITTRLEMNGDCPTRTGRPFVTATIPQQMSVYKRFYRSDVTRDCD